MRRTPVKSGDLRFFGKVEELVSGSWQHYTDIWFDLATESEGESFRRHRVATAWTDKLESIIGLRTLDEGWRVVYRHAHQTQDRHMVIDEITCPENRQGEVFMLVHEVVA